ncbi:MAG: formylglycine-generating enzyme family protein, partial [Thiolinea sp.]
MAALVVYGLWLAWGQAQRMQVLLQGGQSRVGAAKAEAAPANWRYWLGQLGVFGLVLVLAVLGQALWLMQRYELPFRLAWQRPLQQIGVLSVPLPERVTVPAGEFQMGSEEGNESEKPVHTVTIDYSFQMGKYELTFAEYDQFVMAMREAGIGFRNGEGADLVVPYPFPEDEGWGRGSRPVINVSWYNAQDYVNWLSHQTGLQCRLPSEAEWEYAARAGTTTAYWWGNEASHEYANYGKDECCG